MLSLASIALFSQHSFSLKHKIHLRVTTNFRHLFLWSSLIWDSSSAFAFHCTEIFSNWSLVHTYNTIISVCWCLPLVIWRLRSLGRVHSILPRENHPVLLVYPQCAVPFLLLTDMMSSFPSGAMVIGYTGLKSPSKVNSLISRVQDAARWGEPLNDFSKQISQWLG